MVTLLAVALVITVGWLGPYPAQREGSGREQTAGRGIFAGSPFVPHSALTDYEIGRSCCPDKTIGNVNVYLFEQRGITCGSLEAAKSKRFFSYTVETDGKRLPVARVAPTSFFQQASFNIVGLTTGFQPGVTIVFTRIDTAHGGVWHGRITVPRQTSNHKTYAFTGSFAARWCGTKRG